MAAAVGRRESPRDAMLSVAAYTACSSLAIVANKLVISHIPTPGLVFCLQIATTIAVILVGRLAGLIKADEMAWEKVLRFLPYVLSFTMSLYSNGRALAVSNIETVIVFRACAPLIVCFLEWLLLGRELPSPRSFAALTGVVCGAVLYVLSDSEFAMHGIAAYGWVFANLCGITFEMTYGKRLLSKVSFNAPVWGLVLYTNSLALLPMFILALSTGEADRLGTFEVSATGIFWLLVSCAIGVGISWAGWFCRSNVTATTYTLVGVVCKFLSVLMNIMLWDKHASVEGMGALAICLASSSMYRQAPPRAAADGKRPAGALAPRDARVLVVDEERGESQERSELKGGNNK